MKILLLAISISVFAGEKTPVNLNKNLDAAGTSFQLSATSLKVSSLFCCISSASTGVLHVAANSDNADAGETPIELSNSTGSRCFSYDSIKDSQDVSKDNGKTDLMNYHVDGTVTNDDITCIYYK